MKRSAVKHFFNRFGKFAGPAFLVAIGYMDPGNWSTDLAAGAQLGYKLIWVVLLSNLIAILFQTQAARLGIVSGYDLGQACRRYYPRPISFALWITCEIAVAATDLAEVLGSAIALYLLFGIPIVWGVLLTALDVFLLMFLLNFGIRKIEAVILTLIAIIMACFALQMFLAKPDFLHILPGFVPSPMNVQGVYLALGIIGATIMPHNLYLHSALVQTRPIHRTNAAIREATHFNLLDSVVALNLAFVVNAAILVLAASTFHYSGHKEVASIVDAHTLLAPLMGSHLAPLAFAIALLAAGQSSTITGTFAGQIVMEGFIGVRMQPWLRRIVSRLLAIVPALIILFWQGGGAVDSLLVASQVILSLQLPFAVIPLLNFTADRNVMCDFAAGMKIKILGWLSAFFILSLNIYLIGTTLAAGLRTTESWGWMVRFLLLPACFLLLPLLVWLLLEPFFRRKKALVIPLPEIAARPLGDLHPMPSYRCVGIALEANPSHDRQIIAGARAYLKEKKAELVLFHVVESVTARLMGDRVFDMEARQESAYAEGLARELRQDGYSCHWHLIGGDAAGEILRIVQKEKFDVVIVGSHGHGWLGKMFLGSPVSRLKRNLTIPIITVPLTDT